LLKDSAITKYSNAYKLYYALGLAYFKASKYDEAIAAFEKSIDLNLYDASSHYYLGKCCLEQGRTIPALLCFHFYMILEPLRSRSFSTLQLMEQGEENKYEYNSSTAVAPEKYHDESFSDLDMLIKSKIALKDDYKSKAKV